MERDHRSRTAGSKPGPGRPIHFASALRSGVVYLGLSLLILAGLAGPASSPARAEEPDRSRPPELGPPPALSLPPIQESKLSNDVPVLVLEKHTVPLVEIVCVLRAGASLDPAGKTGLASLTAAMLQEGAGTRSSLELADAIDYLGADIGSSADLATTSVTLFVPLSKLEPAFELFADVVLRPTFPPAELERLRKERLTSLTQLRDQPTAIAGLAAAQEVYGRSHPYGRGIMGDEKSIRSLSLSDVKSFYGKNYQAANATFIVVGDVSAADVSARLEKAFGSWTRGAAAPGEVPLPAQVQGRTVFLIDKPDAPQSVLRLSRVGVERSSPDYFPLVVMNTVLGGSFSSRLNHNLREVHGYTYGASSSFDMRIAPGPFSAGASVQTAVTDSALVQFFHELEAIRQGVSEEELTRAKNYVALGFPGDFETVGSIAARLREMVIYNLPRDYFNNYIPSVLAVTREDVQRVANRYIDPQNIDVIVVGDSKTVEKPIRKLGLGPIRPLKVDDILGKAK